MKKDLFISLVLLLIFSAPCQATQQYALSQAVDSPAEITAKTGIAHVYRELVLADKKYYAGFRIDTAGINYPVLVELDKNGEVQHSWEFNDIISDLFIYNATVSVLFDHARSRSLLGGQWVKNGLQAGPASVVVMSNASQQLITCSPASALMSDRYRGGCSSVNPDWKVSFAWREITPRLCGENLVAVSWSQKQNMRLTINPRSGQILKQKPYSGGDICKP